MSGRILSEAQWPHDCFLRDLYPGPGAVAQCDDCNKFYTGYDGERGWRWAEISPRKAKRLIKRNKAAQ